MLSQTNSKALVSSGYQTETGIFNSTPTEALSRRGTYCEGLLERRKLKTTRRPFNDKIYDRSFSSCFEHIGEFIRMTELGMIILRLLELKIENLGMPEILLTCRIRKHIFLFVYAFDDSTTLRFLYKN
ncbi:hypothetical protein CEXT_579691 [Caerostris extrusa]|uniref:Uncharacterized protein n=1 Tax=Caerostris extrusa TaxID=172846 RepID=A0AAV4SKL1_CAEEX|nr:hypothetical protein CEXT_579691 [Caerostris extrusa]